MSIRRAVEYHIKECLTRGLATDFPNYGVVESLRQEERPMPCIIIIAGGGDPALPNLPDSYMNYTVGVTIMIMASVDKETVDGISEVAHTIQGIMRERVTRKESWVQGLYLYEIEGGGVGEENEGRDMGIGLNYTVLCNYDPDYVEPSP